MKNSILSQQIVINYSLEFSFTDYQSQYKNIFYN